MTNEELISAAKDADWMQVVGNGGPPCFHYEDYRQRFCLRAQRWFGHADQPTDVDHKFVSLADLLEANFRRSSQNQTVSSGVEGAHEGTTADEKAELPREHQCVSANDCPLCDEYIPAGSREPEKLNNAQKSVAAAAEPHHRKCGLLHGDTACNCSLWHALCNIQDYIVCEEETPERKLYVVGNELIERIKQNFALAESSLSSPPPTIVVEQKLELCDDCNHSHSFQYDDMIDEDCPVVGCGCMSFKKRKACVHGYTYQCGTCGYVDPSASP